MNNEEIKAEKPNTNTETKPDSNVTVNVHESSSWVKPTLLVTSGIVAGALGALGVLWFMNRNHDGAETVDTTAGV